MLQCSIVGQRASNFNVNTMLCSSETEILIWIPMWQEYYEDSFEIRLTFVTLLRQPFDVHCWRCNVHQRKHFMNLGLSQFQWYSRYLFVGLFVYEEKNLHIRAERFYVWLAIVTAVTITLRQVHMDIKTTSKVLHSMLAVLVVFSLW